MIDAWNAAPQMAVALVGNLVRASIVGGLLVLAAWWLCRANPRLSPAARAWLWWLVSLKFLLVLIAVPVIELPVLPFATDLGGHQMSREIGSVTPPILVNSSSSSSNTADPGTAPLRSPRRAAIGALALVLLWVTGLGLGVLTAAQHFSEARQVRRSAKAIRDRRVLDLFNRLREQIGVRNADLRVHPGIGSPRAMGLWRPLVLISDRALKTLTNQEMEWVLSHELFHLRRKDLWLGLVPATVERLFFFHPLVRLATREYGASRELACDSRVLVRAGSSLGGYGRLLLKLGASAHPASAAAALVEHKSLKRRLEMLHQLTRLPRARSGWLFVLIAVLALFPLRLVASDSVPGPSGPAPAAVPADPPAPPAVASPAGAPTAAAATVAPKTPEAAPDEDSNLRFVLLGKGASASNVEWVDGSSHDVATARALRQGTESLLYVRMNGGAWVIRDPAVLQRVGAAFEPQRELGRQQADLGRQQAELGRQQAELGGKQAELGTRQAELGRQQAKLAIQETELAARQMTLNAALARIRLEGASEARQQPVENAAGGDAAELRKSLQEVSAQQRELSARQRELGDQQRMLGGQQRDLSGQQVPLAERQQPLASKQRELAEQQRAAGIRARRQVREIVERAIAGGHAEAVER